MFGLVLWGSGCAGASSNARHYNLGNAQFLAGQLPEAILTYYGGLRLDPNDQGLRDNLEYVRARVSYPLGDRGRPEEVSWPSWLYRPSVSAVLAASLVLYFVTSVLITRWLMTRHQAHLVRALILLLLGAVCACFWLRLESDDEWQDRHPLVVFREDKVPLRKGNGPSYPLHADLPLLARGMEARRVHERGDWLQIQFASGETGWVERSAVLVEGP